MAYSSSLEKANVEFFDTIAEKYKHQDPVTGQIKRDLSKHAGLIGFEHRDNNRDVKLLDFGCGWGTVSEAFAQYVNSIQAVDLSPKVCSLYNELQSKATDPVLQQARAVCGNLLSSTSSLPTFDGPDFFGFHFIGASMVLHHVSDPVDALRRLGERLRPGGILFLGDFAEEGYLLHKEGSDGDEQQKVKETIENGPWKHTVHGPSWYTEEEMRKLWERAGGFANIRYEVVKEPLEIRMAEVPLVRKWFITRAEKSVESL